MIWCGLRDHGEFSCTFDFMAQEIIDFACKFQTTIILNVYHNNYLILCIVQKMISKYIDLNKEKKLDNDNFDIWHCKIQYLLERGLRNLNIIN